MTTPSRLDAVCAALTERFHDGRLASERLTRWLSGEIPFAYPDILAAHLEEQHVPLLFDAFWQVLPFGTGGRRGRVGYGPNRLNHSTVAMTVQGHCEHLRRAFPDRTPLPVVVANDVRVFKDITGTYRFLGDTHPLLGTSSRSLAKLACEIYAGNGIVAYLSEPLSESAVLTTPELAFQITQLHAAGGINVSASHNPPDDNGVKVYDEFGSQPVAPNDQRLVDAMADATAIKRLPFDEAVAAGLVLGLPAELRAAYVETYVGLYDGLYTPTPTLPVVYTPLCGCGLDTVGKVMTRLGMPFLVPPQQGPDGTFAVIPFKAPNPEVAESTTPAKAFADSVGSAVVLSSDPDADRVGLEARLADGSWYHFDGNQIAAILGYFLMVDPAGPRRRGLVLTTTVTTKLLRRIVEASPGSMIVDDLLVGFKYMADVLKTLGQTKRYKEIEASPDDLVFATEESHGVMLVPTILDKDATPACMYLAALYQRLSLEGRTLLDYYVQMLEELGAYDTVNRSIVMSGAEGLARKDRLMASLRAAAPTALAGQPVLRVVDHWDAQAFGAFVSATDELPRNVIQYTTEHSIITVRPSGTEPKVKCYCQILPGAASSGARGVQLLTEARAVADDIARRVYGELLERIDLSLGEAALWLPDIVDFDRKKDFETTTAPALHAALAADRFARVDDALAWLTSEAGSMTPGADPLPALKAPVACLLRLWDDLAPSPVRDALAQWSAAR